MAILLVVVVHLTTAPEYGRHLPAWFHYLEFNGAFGVSIFFVISGFLITYLLLQEREQLGRISLRAFYMRRALRILPAYYTLLAVVGVLAINHLVPTSFADLADAALFIWNYVGGKNDAWTLGHTWSLSVEEQFYLVWPAAIALLTRRSARRLAIGLIVSAPLVRLLTYAVAPTLRDRIEMMSITRFDTLMYGCVLAFIFTERSGTKWLELLTSKRLLVGAVAITLLSPLLRVILRGPYILLAGESLEGAAITILVTHAIIGTSARANRVLNSRLMVHIGTISYSLYLWQQLFTHTTPGLPTLPLLGRVALTVIVAELSYGVIEKPALRLKRLLSLQRLDRKTVTDQAALQASA